MLTITLRHLLFRRQEFAIAIGGAGLVFALLLILTGISAGFRTEATAMVDATGADAWVVPSGESGPFSSVSTLPANVAARLRDEPGIEMASPLVALPNVADLDGEPHTVNVVGVVPGRLGSPRPDEGQTLAGARETVVGSATGAERGSSLAIGGIDFRVVGTVSDRSYLGGVPVVYVPLADAQALAYDGRPLANTVLIRGSLDQAPAGLKAVPASGVVDDMLKPLEGATSVIDILRILMWLVAALIIGAATYLSALERVGDFAVLKAVGGGSRHVAASLAGQAVLASLSATALAAAISLALRPIFPVPVTIDLGAYLALAAIAGILGVVAGFAALRRALNIDAAIAFSG